LRLGWDGLHCSKIFVKKVNIIWRDDSICPNPPAPGSFGPRDLAKSQSAQRKTLLFKVPESIAFRLENALEKSRAKVLNS
jgi:hypothetical protein